MLRANVGELVIAGLSGASLDDATREALSLRQIAGVYLTRRNVRDKRQLRRLCTSVYEAVPPGDPPPIVCVEQMGGDYSPLSALGVPDWGSPRYLTRHGPEVVEGYALKVGEFLWGLRINANLAPPVSVDPASRRGGSTRCLGSDPDNVARIAAAWVRGLRTGGVEPVTVDLLGGGAPAVADVADLQSVHLRPFQACLEHGVQAVVIAPAVAPALDPEMPASRSQKTRELLEGHLGFRGVTIAREPVPGLGSDSGDAHAQAIIEGLRACSMVLDPRPAAEVARTLVLVRKAALAGELSQDALQISVNRVREWRLTLPDPRQKSASESAEAEAAAPAESGV